MNISGPIPITQANSIDTSKLVLKKAPTEGTQQLRDIQASTFIKPSGVPKDSPFAEVKVGGKTIAKITNNGYVESGEYGSRIRALITNDQGKGPLLAAERATKIAKAFGGSVEKSSSALTPAEWISGSGRTSPGINTNWQSFKLAQETVSTLLRQQEA